jgi:hypothetical protein
LDLAECGSGQATSCGQLLRLSILTSKYVSWESKIETNNSGNPFFRRHDPDPMMTIPGPKGGNLASGYLAERADGEFMTWAWLREVKRRFSWPCAPACTRAVQNLCGAQVGQQLRALCLGGRGCGAAGCFPHTHSPNHFLLTIVKPPVSTGHKISHMSQPAVHTLGTVKTLGRPLEDHIDWFFCNRLLVGFGLVCLL